MHCACNWLGYDHLYAVEAPPPTFQYSPSKRRCAGRPPRRAAPSAYWDFPGGGGGMDYGLDGDEEDVGGGGSPPEASGGASGNGAAHHEPSHESVCSDSGE